MKTARRLDLARILPLLRCPATGAELNITPSGRLVTADGEHSYPILDGVPALIDPSKSLFASEAASGDDANGGRETPRARANRALWALGRRVVPSVSLNVRADRNLRAFGRLLTAGDGSRPKRLLIVAGAIEGTGVGELLDDPRIECFETDVVLGARTQILADAHDLPFADGVFDGVLCQGVLTCVSDPVRVVAEVHRVLAPGAGSSTPRPPSCRASAWVPTTSRGGPTSGIGGSSAGSTRSTPGSNADPGWRSHGASSGS